MRSSIKWLDKTSKYYAININCYISVWYFGDISTIIQYVLRYTNLQPCIAPITNLHLGVTFIKK